MSNYILDGKKAVLCDDVMEWAKWYETADRKVEKTEIEDVRISTVFLGIDHGWNGKLELFETMIFGGEMDQETWRYATWDEAETGHAAAVKKVEQPT